MDRSSRVEKPSLTAAVMPSLDSRNRLSKFKCTAAVSPAAAPLSPLPLGNMTARPAYNAPLPLASSLGNKLMVAPSSAADSINLQLEAFDPRLALSRNRNGIPAKVRARVGAKGWAAWGPSLVMQDYLCL
ncbi:hypothetical protein GGI35DRAFT_484524 [Trichoderma velutinum]